MEIVLTLVGGAILGVVALRLHEIAHSWSRLRRLRYVLPIVTPYQRSKIHLRASLEILTAGAGVESKRAYTHSSETRALQDLAKLFHGLPIDADFHYGDESAIPNANWIILGLSRKKSTIGQPILDRIAVSTKLTVVKPPDAHQYFLDSHRKEYRCEHVADKDFVTRVTKDYGIIYRWVSDNEAVTLLCGGIHMFGTLAAVRVALSEGFVKRVNQKKAIEYVQLVEVAVQEDGINIDTTSIIWQDLPFITINRRSFISKLFNPTKKSGTKSLSS